MSLDMERGGEEVRHYEEMARAEKLTPSEVQLPCLEDLSESLLKKREGELPHQPQLTPGSCASASCRSSASSDYPSGRFSTCCFFKGKKVIE